LPRLWSKIPTAGLVSAGLLAAAAGLSSAQPAAGNVSNRCLLTMRCNGDYAWPSANGSVEGGRYSPLAQINVQNVAHLRLAWKFTTPIIGAEDYPVIVNNVAYVTTAYAYVYALNASTGKLIWKWVPPAEITGGLVSAAHGFPNRGVAVGDGNVYVLTPNAKLVALNAATGKLEWYKSLGDPKWLSESVAPVYYNGVLYIGSAGSESGARGFEEARNAKTGALLWQHYTVPPAGAPGSWLYGHHGGGDVWMMPTLDPSLGLLYIGTGNPSPDLWGGNRPGPNLYADSIMALNMKTGKMVWYYQTTPHDLWDYDCASSPVLFPTSYGLAVGEACKDGYWYEMDAHTGQLIVKPEPFVIENHRMPPPKPPGVWNWPGPVGGSEWSPVPYDPQTHMTYVEGINSPSQEWAKSIPYNGGLDFGTNASTPPSKMISGTLTAFDVNTGTIVWQDHLPVGLAGGSTATGGGLLFAGISGTGAFAAFNARTGKLVWEYNVHNRIDAAPSVYSVNGKEYVLIAVGGTSLTAPQLGGRPAGPAEFLAFALP
jgi:alcohol dehydrogenase (cytochrome c)